jgi:hypothetical protein
MNNYCMYTAHEMVFTYKLQICSVSFRVASSGTFWLLNLQFYWDPELSSPSSVSENHLRLSMQNGLFLLNFKIFF